MSEVLKRQKLKQLISDSSMKAQIKDYFELLFMESHFSHLQNTFRRTADVK